MWWHLTLEGKAAAVWYWVRRRFVPPAPSGERCCMGGPVAPMVHCPRRAMDDELWCRRCTKRLVR
jgi:hypothetical protein